MHESKTFKSEEELAAFVDANDTSALWEQMVEMDASILRVRRRRQSSVRVPLSVSTLRELRALSRQRHIPLDQLLTDWVTKDLQREKQAV